MISSVGDKQSHMSVEIEPVMHQISEDFLVKYEFYVQKLEKENKEIKEKLGSLINECKEKEIEKEEILKSLSDIKKCKGVMSCTHSRCKINSTDYKYEIKKCMICGRNFCQKRIECMENSHYKIHLVECERIDKLERKKEEKRRSKRLIEKEVDEYREESSDCSDGDFGEKDMEEMEDDGDDDDDIIDLAISEGDDDEENEDSGSLSLEEKTNYSLFRI